MKNNAGFQTIALTRIHESTTNPRSIFDESKLAELADFVPGTKWAFCSSDRFVAEKTRSRMTTGGP